MSIGVDSFIIEGEAIKVDKAGTLDFHALQSAAMTGKPLEVHKLPRN